MTEISIGELAQGSGVKIPTIRYYEDIGLMPKADRTGAGRRIYSDADVTRLNFIRHARGLGFPMDDVRNLLSMTADPQHSCHAADSIARRNIETIERKIDVLQSLHGELKRMVDECEQGSVADCRVLQILGEHDHCLHAQHHRT